VIGQRGCRDTLHFRCTPQHKRQAIGRRYVDNGSGAAATFFFFVFFLSKGSVEAANSSEAEAVGAFVVPPQQVGLAPPHILPSSLLQQFWTSTDLPNLLVSSHQATFLPWLAVDWQQNPWEDYSYLTPFLIKH
jgi:hypothetical protein